MMKFEKWIEQLKQVARERYGFSERAIQKSDWTQYEPYYDDGLSPEEAMAADLAEEQ